MHAVRKWLKQIGRPIKYGGHSHSVHLVYHVSQRMRPCDERRVAIAVWPAPPLANYTTVPLGEPTFRSSGCADACKYERPRDRAAGAS